MHFRFLYSQQTFSGIWRVHDTSRTRGIAAAISRMISRLMHNVSLHYITLRDPVYIIKEIDTDCLTKQFTKWNSCPLYSSSETYYSLFHVSIFYYRPQSKLREGYVFTGVCHSVNGGGVCIPACPPLGRYPPRARYTPPGTRYTPPRTRYTPPRDQVHHPPPGTRYTPPGPGTPPRYRKSTFSLQKHIFYIFFSYLYRLMSFSVLLTPI